MDAQNNIGVVGETPASKTIKCQIDAGFGRWIATCGGSIAITTYQAGKVAIVGWTGSQVHVTMRAFARPMGLTAQGDTLALATADELIILGNAPLLAGDYLQNNRYDALFLPRVTYHTGELNLHDLAFGRQGLWAVNTRFCCLCHLSEQFSFVPRWQPKFISQLAPEDRCHLNGMALVNGEPTYVTALGTSDTPRGWVESKADGGVLMHVPTKEIIRDGLCMPHSPRWRDGKLWLLNSGAGELWTIDPSSGKHTVIAQLPGYTRGLDFVGHYALIGMSKVRSKHIFGGLPVQKRCEKLICGAAVVDTRSGKCEGIIEFTDAAEELYDVVYLPGIFKPAILNGQADGSRHGITAPEFSYWMRPDPEKPEPLPMPGASKRLEGATREHPSHVPQPTAVS